MELEKYGGYLLSFNGARIINCRTGDIVFQKTLPPVILPGLYKFSSKAGAFSIGAVIRHLFISKSTKDNKFATSFIGILAMANAQEKVKQAADFITDSNDEDGIVKVIKKFILNES